MSIAVKETVNENQNSIGSLDKINKNEYKEFICEVSLSFYVSIKGPSKDSVRKQLEKTHPDNVYEMNTDYVDIKVHDVSGPYERVINV
jgi:hypothetical protein